MYKKLILLIAACLFKAATAFADVTVNSTNFPDPNFMSWILLQPWGQSGVIATADIPTITSINVLSQNIADLTGIDFFTSLANLYVRDNQLTSLDVSQLTGLQSLTCSYNQLVSLNVSNLPVLSSLDFSTNQLTSFDVGSGLPALTSLNANTNLFVSFDDSGLPALTSLSVSYNQLASLDVSGLTNLTSLSVSNNQLTSLDVSGLSLMGLSVNSNQLSSLNVSRLNLSSLDISNNQFTSLDEVVGLTTLTNLTNLYVANNQLTSFNVLSNLTTLTGLSVSTNQLTSLDVSSLTNLVNLLVDNNQLTSLDVSSLTNLANLNVDSNQLTSVDVSGLGSLTTFSGSSQTPTLTLTGANNNYNLAIDLNNPTNLVSGLSYASGILTSTSSTIVSSPFSVETGNPNFTLEGTLDLIYNYSGIGTNIPEVNVNRTPVAFYTTMGIRIGQKPQSGIFIILYDDGSTEKVMR